MFIRRAFLIVLVLLTIPASLFVGLQLDFIGGVASSFFALMALAALALVLWPIVLRRWLRQSIAVAAGLSLGVVVLLLLGANASDCGTGSGGGAEVCLTRGGQHNLVAIFNNNHTSDEVSWPSRLIIVVECLSLAPLDRETSYP